LPECGLAHPVRAGDHEEQPFSTGTTAPFRVESEPLLDVTVSPSNLVDPFFGSRRQVLPMGQDPPKRRAPPAL
jgi:hypothetical protein